MFSHIKLHTLDGDCFFEGEGAEGISLHCFSRRLFSWLTTMPEDAETNTHTKHFIITLCIICRQDYEQGNLQVVHYSVLSDSRPTANHWVTCFALCLLAPCGLVLFSHDGEEVAITASELLHLFSLGAQLLQSTAQLLYALVGPLWIQYTHIKTSLIQYIISVPNRSLVRELTLFIYFPSVGSVNLNEILNILIVKPIQANRQSQW